MALSCDVVAVSQRCHASVLAMSWRCRLMSMRCHAMFSQLRGCFMALSCDFVAVSQRSNANAVAMSWRLRVMSLRCGCDVKSTLWILYSHVLCYRCDVTAMSCQYPGDVIDAIAMLSQCHGYCMALSCDVVAVSQRCHANAVAMAWRCRVMSLRCHGDVESTPWILYGLVL
jgi:hypothetical protein